ncbi:MAG: ComF family protein [Chitinophagales bacterium]|nr:ComF family protein [Chitinophagales bacterium]
MRKAWDFVRDSLTAVFFPENCCGCGEGLMKNEAHLCLNCLHQLPYTNFENDVDNPANKLFHGRFPFAGGTSWLYFSKSGIVQSVLHELKYHQKPELGIWLGEKMGAHLSKWITEQQIDVVLPVPLHPKKERLRGYNQSGLLAESIAKTNHLRYSPNVLERKSFTDSQTKKSRIDRWENVADMFHLNDAQALQNKHVLLIDDVLTTGATIEACAIALKDVPEIKLSFATLAIATN